MGICWGDLGIDPPSQGVYVVITTYGGLYGGRVFSTREKAERYRDCINNSKHGKGSALKVMYRHIDETTEQTRARCGYAL